MDLFEENLRACFALGGGEFAAIDEDDLADTSLTSTAVLVPIVRRKTGLTVLLTRRTEHLRDHAGQIAFRGGRCEESDNAPFAIE
jgi:8-oxo-dGTP pyrophosphatase MutT (NUDIX family)